MTTTSLRHVVKREERRHICYVLLKSGWSVPTAAEALGVGQSTLYRKMKEHRISIVRFKRPKT